MADLSVTFSFKKGYSYLLAGYRVSGTWEVERQVSNLLPLAFSKVMKGSESETQQTHLAQGLSNTTGREQLETLPHWPGLKVWSQEKRCLLFTQLLGLCCVHSLI